ncbi:ribosomal maturation YjgA family protein [Flavobacterium pedocola]
MLTFNRTYFLLATLIFNTEVMIALFVKDTFIRPYFGDVLVVILIYCFVKSFLKIPVLPAVVSVLLFSYLIEMLQYFNIVEVLNLGHSKVARIVIGSSFEWLDLVAYTAGACLTLLVEKVKISQKIIKKT